MRLSADCACGAFGCVVAADGVCDAHGCVFWSDGAASAAALGGVGACAAAVAASAVSDVGVVLTSAGDGAAASTVGTGAGGGEMSKRTDRGPRCDDETCVSRGGRGVGACPVVCVACGAAGGRVGLAVGALEVAASRFDGAASVARCAAGVGAAGVRETVAAHASSRSSSSLRRTTLRARWRAIISNCSRSRHAIAAATLSAPPGWTLLLGGVNPCGCQWPLTRVVQAWTAALVSAASGL